MYELLLRIKVCRPVLKRIIQPVKAALEMAGITKAQVDRILLVVLLISQL